jgi:hypothetical protein
MNLRPSIDASENRSAKQEPPSHSDLKALVVSDKHFSTLLTLQSLCARVILFHRHTLGQVTGLVDVGALEDRHVVGQ